MKPTLEILLSASKSPSLHIISNGKSIDIAHAVRSVSFHFDAGDVPRCRLELAADSITILAAESELKISGVDMPDAMRAALFEYLRALPAFKAGV